MNRVWVKLKSFLGTRELHYLAGLVLVSVVLWPLGWQWSVGFVGVVFLYVGLWWSR